MKGHDKHTCWKLPGKEYLRNLIGFCKFNKFGKAKTNNTNGIDANSSSNGVGTSNHVLAGGLHLSCIPCSIEEKRPEPVLLSKPQIEILYRHDDNYYNDIVFSHEEKSIQSIRKHSIWVARKELLIMKTKLNLN